MSDIVDTLREDMRCLTSMAEASRFAGDDTCVRVKRPAALIAALGEAADEIVRLRAENEQLRSVEETTHGLYRFWNEKAQELAGKLATARAEAFERAAQIVEIAEKLKHPTIDKHDQGWVDCAHYLAEAIRKEGKE